MNDLFILGLALGMLAALLMNVGKGVQKQFVHVFSHWREMFHPPYRGKLLLWILGFAMTASATIPFSLGLKLSQSPSAVSAMTGVGLIGLGLYAVYVIGERFGREDFLGIALVVVGTSLLAYLGGEHSESIRKFTTWRLVAAVVTLVVGGVLCCYVSRFWPKMHGLAYGSMAGMLIGLALFLADIALVEAGGDFVGQLSNPFPYIALVFAATATVVTQFGFLKSRAIEVVSAVNSATILTPLFLEVTVYGLYPVVVQVVLMLVIVSGVLLLSRGAAARVSG